MGFLRKATFVATGGASGLVIKANSKKERMAKAAEKQLALQKQALKQQQAGQRAAAVTSRSTVAAAPERPRLAVVEPYGRHAKKDAPAQDLLVGVADEIAKLGRLRDQGLLTDAEFGAQKAKLLGAAPNAERPAPEAASGPTLTWEERERLNDLR